MSLQSLLDEFKGRSLLDTKVISLPSPIMLELLEMKGKDRIEEEERHYQTLLKNCTRSKLDQIARVAIGDVAVVDGRLKKKKR